MNFNSAPPIHGIRCCLYWRHWFWGPCHGRRVCGSTVGLRLFVEIKLNIFCNFYIQFIYYTDMTSIHRAPYCNVVASHMSKFRSKTAADNHGSFIYPKNWSRDAVPYCRGPEPCTTFLEKYWITASIVTSNYSIKHKFLLVVLCRYITLYLSLLSNLKLS